MEHHTIILEFLSNLDTKDFIDCQQPVKLKDASFFENSTRRANKTSSSYADASESLKTMA